MSFIKLDVKTVSLISLWTRKLHRLMMWLAIALFLPMASTGLALEDFSEGEIGLTGRILTVFIDPNQIRSLHRSLSTFFVVILGMMIATGFIIWLVPFGQRWLLNRNHG